MDCGTFRVTLLHCVNLTIQKTQACFWDQRQPLVGIPKTSQIVSKSLAINSHSMEIPWNILSLPRIDMKWKKWPLVILNIFNFKLQRNFFSVKEEKKGERERSKVGERKGKGKKKKTFTLGWYLRGKNAYGGTILKHPSACWIAEKVLYVMGKWYWLAPTLAGFLKTITHPLVQVGEATAPCISEFVPHTTTNGK